MNRPTETPRLPARADLSLNWVIRLASPKPVRHSNTQDSWACSGTWLCMNSTHRPGSEAGGEQLRHRRPAAFAQLIPSRRIERYRVQVNDAVERLVGVLQRHPLAQRAEIVPEVE